MNKTKSIVTKHKVFLNKGEKDRAYIIKKKMIKELNDEFILISKIIENEEQIRPFLKKKYKESLEKLLTKISIEINTQIENRYINA